jgi:hypothetical protein
VAQVQSALWYLSQLSFANAAEEPTVIQRQIYAIGDDISMIMEVEGAFFELFELDHFPFDHQSVSCKLRCSCAKEGEIPVKFTGLEDAVEVVEVKEFALQNTWEIEKKLEVETDETSPMEGRTYPVLIFTAHVNRLPGFYLWNVIIPMSMLSLAGFLQFEVAKEDVADRASISLTLLLTAVAYKLVTAGMVPAISYLTLLDKFVSANILLMLVFVLESGIANELHDMGYDYRERLSIMFLMIIWLGIHAWFVADAMATRRRLRAEREERDEDFAREEASRKGAYHSMIRHANTQPLPAASRVAKPKEQL